MKGGPRPEAIHTGRGGDVRADLPGLVRNEALSPGDDRLMGHWTDDLANVSDSVRQMRATFDHRGNAFPEGWCFRAAGAC